MASVAAASKRRSFIVRHWRGELSLPRSYWIDGVLIFGLGINILFIVATICAVVLLHGSPALMTAALLTALAVQVLVYIWAVVGVWRSAGRYAGPKVWSILARVVVVLGVFISIGHLMQDLHLIQLATSQ
ncbi:MAG TPA: hypothetical protein VKU90_06150 [Caulobacteraceae bacterium]|nr:hypothetical protein [Caulobacteraceae bacterium]